MARFIFAALFVLTSFVAGLLPVTAEEFRHKGLNDDAARFETWLRANWKPDIKKLRRYIPEGEALMEGGKDPRGASGQFSNAVVGEPGNSLAWVRLAQSLLAIPEANLSGAERYRTPVNASAAAYRAYQTATSKDTQATALVVLSQTLQRRSFWRPAIETLKLSLELKSD